VLLAGLRPELMEALARVGITRQVPAERTFVEEDQQYSATLNAIRKAYALRSGHITLEPAQPEGGAYYLV
jgi:SulP family sulfate permease